MSPAPDSSRTADVVIVGGGVIGSSIAYFLAAEPAFDGSVVVIERDPTYRDGSTARSVGGIRLQFSTPENIESSKFGASFMKSADELLAVGDDRPDIAFCEAGYLLLASPRGLEILEANHRLQVAHDASVARLTPEELSRRFPWLTVTDLAGGTLGLADEGWLDPYSLLMAFRRKAESLGVAYRHGEVVAVDRRGSRIAGVRLADGDVVACGQLVNAAGPRAADLAAMAGIDDCPVRSKKRTVYTFRSPATLPDCPLVVDPTGVYFRPEGDKFVCGVSPPADQDPDSHDFAVDDRLFEEVVWPRLAHRVAGFESLRLGTCWAGHYAVNVRDQNAILGPHPELEGFHFANGFSGHGLQQAPAVGRALSELITFGRYRTLDLGRFAYGRFETGELVEERSVI